MTRKKPIVGSLNSLLAALVLALGLYCSQASSAVAADPAVPVELKTQVNGPQRTAAHKARDGFRRPGEVLAFLGVRPDSHVVEILPGAGGYWTEILAPYLSDRGLYIAAGPNAARSTKAGISKLIKRYDDKLAGDPKSYGKVRKTVFDPGHAELAPAGSVDFVLTFRNLHNWMKAGTTEQALAVFHKALKPGGVLGIVEHRGRADQPQDPKALSGYVRQDYAIALIEKAGFKLAGSSEVNANPKDSKDHPAGVWTLPPSYRLKDKDRDKYAAIGESDRFTLKFVKR